MTQEEKQLLLKDLCARVPYGVKIFHRGSVEEIQEITPTGEFKNYNYNAWFSIDSCKPYLRPMSSMTDKEQTEWHNTTLGQRWITENNIERCVDWLNSHHFDYRGLIEKGLALEAPEDMYKTE